MRPEPTTPLTAAEYIALVSMAARLAAEEAAADDTDQEEEQ